MNHQNVKGVRRYRDDKERTFYDIIVIKWNEKYGIYEAAFRFGANSPFDDTGDERMCAGTVDGAKMRVLEDTGLKAKDFDWHGYYLKPCPFCGSEELSARTVILTNGVMLNLQCACGASMRVPEAEGEKKLFKNWNRRIRKGDDKNGHED